MHPARGSRTGYRVPAPFAGCHRLITWVCRCLLAVVTSQNGILAVSPPPAESWLPTNTIAFVTLPDAQATRTSWKQQAPGRFWNDPAMASFRTNFETQARLRLASPLSRATGFDLSRLPDLAEGQVTLALLQEGRSGTQPYALTQILLVDAGSRAQALNQWITNRTSPVPVPRLQLGGVEFLQLTLSQATLDQALSQILPPLDDPPAAPLQPPPPTSVFVGQREGVLYVGTSSNALIQVLRRIQQPPNPTPSLSTAVSNAAPVWIHGSVQVNQLLPSLSSAPVSLGGLLPADGGPSVARIATALGLAQLRSASFKIHAAREGWFLDLHLALPAAARSGLFSLFQFQPLPSEPLPFIPNQAREFTRARFSGPAAWSAVEKTLRDIDPAWLGVFQLFTGYAGRAEDADFDFEKRVIPLLGDDWISAAIPTGAEKPPASLFVIGSPRAEELAQSLRLVASPIYLATFFPPDSPSPQRTERQFSGATITSISLPPMPWNNGATGAFHFAGLRNHLAFSSDASVIESFLSTNPPPSLGQRPGLLAAAALAGGTQGGYFSYSNERQTAANAFAAFASSPHALTDRFPWITLSATGTRLLAGIESWLDGSLLPPFGAISNHFGFRVSSGKLRPDGYELTTFRPVPGPN